MHYKVQNGRILDPRLTDAELKVKERVRDAVDVLDYSLLRGSIDD